MSSSSTAFDEWAAATRDLANAEIEVVRWQLHESSPVPSELTANVEELRDRAAFCLKSHRRTWHRLTTQAQRSFSAALRHWLCGVWSPTRIRPSHWTARRRTIGS